MKKYLTPLYEKENAEVKDVITNSFLQEEKVNEITGEKTSVVTGYLSHLLGKM